MNKLFLAILLLVALALFGCQEQSQGQAAAASATSSSGAGQDSDKAAAVPAPAPTEVAPSAGSEPAPELQAGLAHHNFIFESLDGRKVPDTNPDGSRRERPNLSFGEWPHANGRICNSYRGQVTLDGRTLTMKNAASTMMLCVDPIINELESTFYAMMSAGVAVGLDQRTLTLTGSGHTLVLTLSDYVN